MKLLTKCFVFIIWQPHFPRTAYFTDQLVLIVIVQNETPDYLLLFHNEHTSDAFQAVWLNGLVQ